MPLSYLLVKDWREWARRLALIVGASLIAGLPGLITVLLLAVIRRVSWAGDSHEKHGISDQQASRLGGIGICICALGVYFSASSIESLAVQIRPEILFAPLAFAIAAGALGLFEDFHGALSPKLRLALMVLVFALCLLANPDLLPASVGIPGVNLLLAYAPLAFVLVLFAAVAAVNAMNIADGANGLMPVVFACVFLAFMMITGRVEYFALLLALMVFALYNLLSGRLFLGDGGAYGLGAAVVIGALEIMSKQMASIFFILCLLSYPAIEITYSAIRRMRAGHYPMHADNEHFHNRLFRLLKSKGWNSIPANGVTGLCISLPTAGASLALLPVWGANSAVWPAVFVVFVVFYLFIYTRLSADE